MVVIVVIICLLGHVSLSHSADPVNCFSADGLSLPTNCCHEGKDLFNRTTLKTCYEQKKGSVGEFSILNSILNCYFMDHQLIDTETTEVQLDSVKKHFQDNYPVPTEFMDICGPTLDGVRVSEEDIYGNKLIYWTLCIEKYFVACARDSQIQTLGCSNLKGYLKSCVQENGPKREFLLDVINEMMKLI